MSASVFAFSELNVLDGAADFPEDAVADGLEGVACAGFGAAAAAGLGSASGAAVDAGDGAAAGAGGGGVGLLPPMFSVIVGGGLGASSCSGRSMGGGGG